MDLANRRERSGGFQESARDQLSPSTPQGLAEKNSLPLFALLLGLAMAGGGAWLVQILLGIGVTGKNRPVFWGGYIASYIFWMGVSSTGGICSSTIRLWGRGSWFPLLRFAEWTALLALCVGALFPLVHLGRPALFYALVPMPNSRFLWPNFHSPLVWDFLGINAYLLGLLAQLYLSLLPDLARAGRGNPRIVAKIFQLVSLRWGNTPEEKQILKKAGTITAFLMLPAAAIPLSISLHLVFSLNGKQLIFPWPLAVLSGVQFLSGALLSGLAAFTLLVALAGRLDRTVSQSRLLLLSRLNRLLKDVALGWVALTFLNGQAGWISDSPGKQAMADALLSGDYCGMFWSALLLVVAVPFLGSLVPGKRGIELLPPLSILTGVWMDRLLAIVIPLSHPLLSYNSRIYHPSAVELFIVLASFMLFGLIFLVSYKVLPGWEFRLEANFQKELDDASKGRKEPIDENGKRAGNKPPNVLEKYNPGLEL
jgi:molybdopterin-containing oxidoreductase family membrane subunit